MANKPRDTYKYQFKVGNKVVHGGITNDLDRREAEHKQKWAKGHITTGRSKDDGGICSCMGEGEGVLVAVLGCRLC